MCPSHVFLKFKLLVYSKQNNNMDPLGLTPMKTPYLLVMKSTLGLEVRLSQDSATARPTAASSATPSLTYPGRLESVGEVMYVDS